MPLTICRPSSPQSPLYCMRGSLSHCSMICCPASNASRPSGGGGAPCRPRRTPPLLLLLLISRARQPPCCGLLTSAGARALPRHALPTAARHGYGSGGVPCKPRPHGLAQRQRRSSSSRRVQTSVLLSGVPDPAGPPTKRFRAQPDEGEGLPRYHPECSMLV